MQHSLIASRKMGGFSLIEVLIAMLILAFGVLSMGGLQLAAMKSGQIASNTSLAATLAKDYTEMMRANWTTSNMTSTVANPYLSLFSSTSTFETTAATTVPDCITSACTGANMATLHAVDWARRVKAQLPGGQAVVCRDPAPRNSDGTYRWGCGTNDGTVVTIKIGWIDKRESVERGTTTISATPLNPQLMMAGFTGYYE